MHKNRLFIIFCFVVILFSENLNAQTEFVTRKVYANKDSLNELLLEAVFKNNFTKAEKLIQQGANVNVTSDDGVTPIFYAIEKLNYQMVKLLMENKADVNFKANDETGETPLILATKIGNLSIINLLLSDTIKVDLQNSNGSSALHFAAFYNDSATTSLLLKKNANIEVKNNNGATPLSLAASNGALKTLVLLINNGADVNNADKLKNTPLMYACSNGQYDAAYLLLSNWASVNAANISNQTALYFSIENKYPEIVDLLLLNGARPNEVYSLSMTPLSVAKISKQYGIADSLKKLGAKQNYLPSFHNSTAFGLNSRFNNRDFIIGLKYLAKDEKFNLEYSLFYNIHPFAVPVLLETGKNTYYQYWERRSTLGFSLGKLFEFHRRNDDYSGVYFEGLYEYNWGKYRGTNIPITEGIQLKPCIGFEIKSNNTTFRLSWIYEKASTEQFPNWYVEFSFMHSFIKHKSVNTIQLIP